MEVHFNEMAQSRPIREIAYEQLKHAIITGQISAGSRIVETAYAEQLHISRTPLREALQKLEHDGLVEYIPHHGVIVKAFTISDIEEIFIIRNSMMMLLLPSIVQNARPEKLEELDEVLRVMDTALERDDIDALAQYNRKFHKGLEHISDKHRILYVIDSQEEYIMRFSAMAIASISRRGVAHMEHHKMLEQLKNKDLEGLKALMQHHLEESKDTCLNAVKNRGY